MGPGNENISPVDSGGNLGEKGAGRPRRAIVPILYSDCFCSHIWLWKGVNVP